MPTKVESGNSLDGRLTSTADFSADQVQVSRTYPQENFRPRKALPKDIPPPTLDEKMMKDLLAKSLRNNDSGNTENFRLEETRRRRPVYEEEDVEEIGEVDPDARELLIEIIDIQETLFEKIALLAELLEVDIE